MAFLCQTISSNGGIVGAIELVGSQDGLLTRDIKQLTRLPVRLMNLTFVQTILSIVLLIRPLHQIIPKAVLEDAFKTGVARQ